MQLTLTTLTISYPLKPARKTSGRPLWQRKNGKPRSAPIDVSDLLGDASMQTADVIEAIRAKCATLDKKLAWLCRSRALELAANPDSDFKELKAWSLIVLKLRKLEEAESHAKAAPKVVTEAEYKAAIERFKQGLPIWPDDQS